LTAVFRTLCYMLDGVRVDVSARPHNFSLSLLTQFVGWAMRNVPTAPSRERNCSPHEHSDMWVSLSTKSRVSLRSPGATLALSHPEIYDQHRADRRAGAASQVLVVPCVTPSMPAALHRYFRIKQRLHQWLFGLPRIGRSSGGMLRGVEASIPLKILTLEVSSPKITSSPGSHFVCRESKRRRISRGAGAELLG